MNLARIETKRHTNALTRLIERLPLDRILPTIRQILPNDRQYQMVEHALHGATLKETAYKLGLNVNSVVYHWDRINKSAGTTNRPASILLLGVAVGYVLASRSRQLPDESGRVIEAE